MFEFERFKKEPLRLGEIDLTKEPVSPKLTLCKPTREEISYISEAYDVKFKNKLGALNELSFRVPVYIERNHNFVKNKNYKNIKGRYTVKMELGNYVEYFIINSTNPVADGKEEILNVELFSSGYELNDDTIRGLSVVSKTATELLTIALKDTIWTVGYVDSDFDLKRRSLEVSSSTVLEVVFDLAKTFNAIIVWDSINRKVNFFKVDNYGKDRGFSIKYGKYLERLNKNENTEEIVTRLKVYGSEDKSINGINPTGSNYIEDFSYFIFPYKETLNHVEKTLSKSDFKLTNALTQKGDYQSNAKNKKLTFEARVLSDIGGKFGVASGDIFVEWERGLRNPKLTQMEDDLEQKKKDSKEVLGNWNEAKDKLLYEQVREKTLKDSIESKNNQISKQMNIIAQEKAVGREVGLLEKSLTMFENDRDELRKAQNKNKIDLKSATDDVPVKEKIYRDILVEQRDLEIEIEVEKTRYVSGKMKVYHLGNLLGESKIVDGFEKEITYKFQVEFHNDRVLAWVDNRLVLNVKDSRIEEKASNSISIHQESVNLQVSNIVLEEKDYTVDSYSTYLTSDLCHYMIEYDNKVEKLSEEYTLYLERLKSHNSHLFDLNRELAERETEAKIIRDKRDVINTRLAIKNDDIANASNKVLNEDTLRRQRQELESIRDTHNNELKTKESEINTVKLKITEVETKIAIVKDDIYELQVEMSLDNNFPEDLLKERIQHTIVREWSDSNITKEEDLLKEAMREMSNVNKPTVFLDINIVNFLAMITEQRNHDKLVIGDSFDIEHERLDIFMKAKLTESEYDFEESSIRIKISNVIDTSKDAFIDMIYDSAKSSTTVDIDKWKWDTALENKGAINDIINNIWDANKQAILGAKDQSVEISDKGLIIRDPKDPCNYLVGINSMLAITNDCGETWKHAITSEGIVGERIYGKVIMGVNLAIEDEDGIVKWQGSKGTIVDRNGDEVMKIGLISEKNDPDCFGLTAKNYVNRVTVSDCVGFMIEKREEDLNWKKVMWADTDGTLYTEGLVAKNIKIVDDMDNLLLDAENNFMNIGEFKNIVADGKLTTMEKRRLIEELRKINADYRHLMEQTGKYMRLHADDIINVDGQAYQVNVDGNTEARLPFQPSTKDRFNTDPLSQAWINLQKMMAEHIKITQFGDSFQDIEIDVEHELTERTTEVNNPEQFVVTWDRYYLESKKLKREIQDALYTTGINMGEYHNSLVMGKFGFIALRSDGKYRAYLNATNGLALEKWENNRWVKKLYASIGNEEYTDGTLIAEELVAKKLRIENVKGEVLLDMDSLNFDFTVLESIIYDNIISAPEKAVLRKTRDSLEGSYVKLREQALNYIHNVYNDGRYTWSELDDAKGRLEDALDKMKNSFETLDNVLDKVFEDMNKTTHIQEDLGISNQQFVDLFQQFNVDFEGTRNALEDFIEKSSLQLGKTYNTTLIDAENGITVARGDCGVVTRLNATKGISITVGGSGSAPDSCSGGKEVFSVDDEGHLFAVDIKTYALHIMDGDLGEAITFDKDDGITIYGKNGEVIRLNGNEGISIHVNDDPRIWIGTDGLLYAKKLVVLGDESDEILQDIDGSYISDLTVSKVRTINQNNRTDHVFIYDNYIKLITRLGDKDFDKFELTFKSSGADAYPVMTWGAGAGDGADGTRRKNRGFIEKTRERFHMFYYDTPDKYSGLAFLDTNDPKGSQGSFILETSRSAMFESAEGGYSFKGKTNFLVEVGEKLEFKVGASTFTMTATEIKLNGQKISLN